jgi:hypothetical protein
MLLLTLTRADRLILGVAFNPSYNETNPQMPQMTQMNEERRDEK